MANTSTTKYPLLMNSKETQQLLQCENKCDKYDYLVSVACGAIGGMIDIFLVGSPSNSVLGKWTDTQVDNAVKGFAKMVGWNPRESQANNVASAIGFLEKKYSVNYDQRHTKDVNDLFNMSAKNHHMKSLSHSPDIIGLFFSLLNQFTSTSSFISDGKVITINSETFELQGGNFIAKLFCGIANWFGHIMSDIAGSSGTRGNGGRGTGVVMPFYELFQFCKFGKFSVGKDKQDLATIATRAFQEGYDFRFGLATAIPVVITDLTIRLIWSLRRYFQFGKPLKECIPTKKHADLRVMLLFGHGTLCVMDGIDAGVRSGGNFLAFFMRMNLIAWFRFVTLVLKEIFIRVGIADSLQMNIEAYKRINEALLLHLSELEKIDIDLFKKETEEYNQIVTIFSSVKSEKELNTVLLLTFDRMGFNKPWSGDFDAHMSNKNATLTFE
ncbi:hypothetical protein [Lysinibacillus sp. OTC-L20]|uniref:hypothetical protein n=1 Tax=Lysinibacillus sp. OTC-L20 TaxID=3342791 RepID=UPI0035B83864